MKKICIVTGTRAEYGLLYWLLKEIEQDTKLNLQLIVTGMHLSPEFGMTVSEIEKDGFRIIRKVETLLSSDTPQGISKAIGIGVIGFADAFADCKPDIVVVLGDRFEILSACIAAMITRIPIAHIHGGELTEGAIDDAIRHSITKMAYLHFTSTETYRKRIIQLGEDPKRVYMVGALAMDNIKKIELLTYDEFQKKIGFALGKKNLLVTFHPVSLEEQSAKDQFQELLQALDKLQDTHLIFTMPNADTDGRVIAKMIQEYVSQNSGKAISFTSMGQLLYLSALQFVDGIVGNSSSGLIEAPSFQVGTVNIGDRQRGRLKAISVIDCVPDCEMIYSAIQQIYTSEFRTKIKVLENPYDKSKTLVSAEIKSILNKILMQTVSLKKEFFDIGFAY